MGQPAARVGDMHVCPMSDGPKPHVGGPVLPPGKPTVLIGGMPAATVGSECSCASVPDVIIQGAATVLIEGQPAARMGDLTVHGGRVVIGCPTVLIGGPSSFDSSFMAFAPSPPSWWDIWGKMAAIGALAVLGIVAAIIGWTVVATGVTVAFFAIGTYQLFTGRNIFTGNPLTTTEKWWNLVNLVPVLGWAAKGIKVIVTARRAAQIAKTTQAAGTAATEKVGSALTGVKVDVIFEGAKSGEAAGKTGTTVLGHSSQYVKVAEIIGARTFQIPIKIWDKMTPAQKWGANQKFLDRMILRGDNIRLATPLNQVKPGSFYQKELNYLFDKGYKVSSDGLWLVK